MQMITGRTEELSRQLAVRAQLAFAALAERAREQRGQTAAEYMGILLIVALIIGALVSLDVDGKIKTAVGDFIENIKKGDKTD
jgi:Flp pilus assembly pilin Flp